MEILQIVVVSACEKRKATLERQFKELDITCPIHYLEAKYLDVDADSYLPSVVTPLNRRIILSTRSHIRAVEFAGRDSSPEFTLIVEDDIAIHKTDFKPILFDIVSRFDSLVGAHSNIISLGWVPCNNYSAYHTAETSYNVNEHYKILLRFTPGTQAYLIKRSVAKEYTPVFVHNTYEELRTSILARNNQYLRKDDDVVVFDDFGTKIMNQCVLFPPIVIEQKNVSLIRDTTDNPYWNQYFKGYEQLQSNYWSF